MEMIVDDLQRSSQYLCHGEQSEIALVRSAQSGSLDSFNAIVLKYQDMMFHTALRILEQDDLADDAIQETFISAYHHIKDFRGGSLKAWLMRIVVNKCYDQIRRIQRSATTSLSGGFMEDREDENPYVRHQDQALSVEEYVEASERNERIQECLNKLSLHNRIIIMLVDIEEMSYNEASAILKIPIGTVKSRLARARFNLREELKAGGKL